MPKFKTNGIELFAEIQGDGAPLVLIPGLGYDHWMYHEMIPGLAENFQVIAIDNRGSGQSDAPAGAYSAEMMADDLAGLMAELNLPHAHILGHSMGGFVAQALALKRPELVHKLVLSATNFGGPHHIPVSPQAMQILLDPSGDPLERFKRGLEVSCAPGFAEREPEKLAKWIEYRVHTPINPAAYQSQLAVGLGLLAETASFEHRLSQIDKPTLILFGEHDQVVPVGNADLLHAKIAGSQVHIINAAGHFFPLEKAAEAVQAITTFLTGS